MDRGFLLRHQRWFLIALAALTGAAVALAISGTLPARYRAETAILVSGENASRELQLSYAELIVSDNYLEVPAADLGIPVDELREGLRAIPAPGTTIVGIAVTLRDDVDAIERANSVAANFGPYLEANGLGRAENAAVIGRSTSARRLTSTVGNVLAGAAAGAVAGLAAFEAAARRRRTALNAAAGRTIEPQIDRTLVESE
jgi:capsular polysaccharide biosynthesis protein